MSADINANVVIRFRESVGQTNETRSFPPGDHLRLGPSGSFLVSPRTVVTERFVRVAYDRIDYTFTVDDPTYYTQP